MTTSSITTPLHRNTNNSDSDDYSVEQLTSTQQNPINTNVILIINATFHNLHQNLRSPPDSPTTSSNYNHLLPSYSPRTSPIDPFNHNFDD